MNPPLKQRKVSPAMNQLRLKPFFSLPKTGFLHFIAALLLLSLTSTNSSQAATPIPDLSEIAYYEMLREQGIEPQKALASGEDCSPRSEMSHKVGIIGQDRRRRLSAQEEQDYSGVVAIHSEKSGEGGSGFLVCDGSVVLTSAHSFYADNGQLLADFSTYRAHLSNKAGEFQAMEFDTRPGSRILGGTHDLPTNREQDWILIRLKSRPNPRNFKPLKVRAQPEVLQVSNQPNAGIKAVGFLNRDNWNRYASPCLNVRSMSSIWSFSSSSAKLYSHDCSTEVGASGSPLIQGSCQGAPQAIALQSAGPRDFRRAFDPKDPFGNNLATAISPEIIEGMRRLCGDSFQTAVCPPQDRVARQ